MKEKKRERKLTPGRATSHPGLPQITPLLDFAIN